MSAIVLHCVLNVCPTRNAALCALLTLSLSALHATGAKSWNMARTYPRSPSSSSSWTKRYRLSCDRCTVPLIIRQLTSWRRLSLWMTTVMKVSSTGISDLQNIRRVFNFLKSHGGVALLWEWWHCWEAHGVRWWVCWLAHQFCSKKGTGSNQS